MHIFFVNRKEQVIGMIPVVLTLVLQSSDIAACHCIISALHFRTGLCSLGASNFV